MSDEERTWPPGEVAPNDVTLTELALHVLLWGSVLIESDTASEQLKGYGLHKVAMYAAQVARAQALGFDPDLLRATPEEANSALLERAAHLVFEGVPTFVIDPDNPEVRGV